MIIVFINKNRKSFCSLLLNKIFFNLKLFQIKKTLGLISVIFVTKFHLFLS
jgi:hypothetical protein